MLDSHIGYLVFYAQSFSILYSTIQIYEIYKKKLGTNIPYWTLILQNISNIIWLIYAINRNSIMFGLSASMSIIHNFFLWKTKSPPKCTPDQQSTNI